MPGVKKLFDQWTRGIEHEQFNNSTNDHSIIIIPKNMSKDLSHLERSQILFKMEELSKKLFLSSYQKFTVQMKRIHNLPVELLSKVFSGFKAKKTVIINFETFYYAASQTLDIEIELIDRFLSGIDHLGR